MPKHGKADNSGPRVGNRLRHEHSLQLKEVRQNQQERNQQNHLTAGVQEHGSERLSGPLEKVPRYHAEGNHEECSRKDAHGPGGKLYQLGIVRGKRCHEGFCLPHENCPGNEHEPACVNEGELEGFLDAAVEAGAVVVADNRLRSVDKSEERQDDNRNDAVRDAECGNRHVAPRKGSGRLDADVSVSGEAPGQNRVHQAVANLHHGRRQAENVNLADIGCTEFHVAPANVDRRCFLDEKLRDECRGDKLRGDGRPGGAFDTPVEFHDKEVVEDNVRDGARDFTEHGRFGVSHRTDKVVHAGGDCLEHGAAQQNAHVAAGNRQSLLACTEQFQERHHENFAERECPKRH